MHPVIEKIGTKAFTVEEIHKYLGPYRGVYRSYSGEEALRQNAASGGSTSQILIYMLETGQIDGAVVLQSYVEDDQYKARFIIARTREEIMAAQGSKYIAVNFLKDAVALMYDFPGKLAVVALPCDAKKLHFLREKSPEFDAKIQLVITLVCGHNSEPALTQKIVEEYRPSPRSKLKSFRHRFGHWRGKLRITYDTGEEVIQPFSKFSVYQNLYFFAQRKCHYCFDHFGYYCDISAGDIWSLALKNNPIKHTGLVTRSEAGERLVHEMAAAGALITEPMTAKEICDGQSRTMPFHYNMGARTIVGKLFGEKIRNMNGDPAHWSHFISAFIALFNERLSRSWLGRKIIFAVPRKLLNLYLYFFKFIELF